MAAKGGFTYMVISSVAFIVSILIYITVYGTLNLDKFDAGTQALLPLIALALVGGFILNIVLYSFVT